MTKEPLKSLILRKFGNRQNEHSMNMDEHRSSIFMFTGEKCVNIENLPDYANAPPAPQDGNAMLAGLDLRNVRPWTEGRDSPRRAQKPPGPRATAGPETTRGNRPLAGGSQTPAPPKEQRAQRAAGKAPVPGTLRWELLPCTLVPVALQLDASGALTWQAGQFDENVRALCEEHGARIRAFLSTLPGHRWESWQENALEAADRWEAGQGARQKGAKA